MAISFRRNPEIEHRPGDEIVALENLAKSFGDSRIIDGVDLSIFKGDITVITGPSGSGKSTILRSMAGLEEPDEGSVHLFSHDLYDMRDKQRSRLISRRVGVGFQSHNLDTGLSVLDNLQSLAEARGDVDPYRIGRIATMLGLQDKILSDESVASLSGGEKQRVALGRLLVPKPELVLLDEPTAAIDPHGKESIYQALSELNATEGTTFVVISHDEIARQYAHREVIVDSGRLVQDVRFDPVAYR